MIPFKYGTQAQYDSETKDNSALYFISDTKRIYRGEELIAGVQALVVTRLPSFSAAVDGVIYVVVNDGSAQLYVKGDNDMVTMTAEVAENSIRDIDAFDSDMLITSADDFNNADDSALATAGAIKAAIEDATGCWEYLDGIADTSRIYG